MPKRPARCEIVTDNQGCIMQLRGGSDAQGRPLEVLHLAQLVAEGVDAARERLEADSRTLQPSRSPFGTDGAAAT